MNTAVEMKPNEFDDAIFYLNDFPEVTVTWVADHIGEFDFVDIREPHELEGPLGSADGVENCPLGRFLESLDSRDKTRPLVLMCRSGRRSALAAQAAINAGFRHVASAEGGMIAWNQYVLKDATIRARERAENAENLQDAVFNYNGIPEVSVQWASHNLGRFRLVDVRTSEELVGPLGRVLQSEHVPLGELVDTVGSWDKNAPYVVMCKSGGRSGRAVQTMINAGFTNVASLEGGMMAWNGAELPVARPN